MNFIERHHKLIQKLKVNQKLFGNDGKKGIHQGNHKCSNSTKQDLSKEYVLLGIPKDKFSLIRIFFSSYMVGLPSRGPSVLLYAHLPHSQSVK